MTARVVCDLKAVTPHPVNEYCERPRCPRCAMPLTASRDIEADSECIACGYQGYAVHRDVRQELELRAGKAPLGPRHGGERL